MTEHKKTPITTTRIVLWILASGVGIFMVVTGIVGILVKAQ
jgi:hypothetical protein